MWTKGQDLSAQTLNKKTAEIGRQYSFGGSKSKSIDKTPSLVFRQESSSIPDDGESFPRYYLERDVQVLAMRCRNSNDTATFQVTLVRIDESDVETDLITVYDSDTYRVFLPALIDGFSPKEQSLTLRVDSSTDVADFQANVILKVLS